MSHPSSDKKIAALLVKLQPLSRSSEVIDMNQFLLQQKKNVSIPRFTVGEKWYVFQVIRCWTYSQIVTNNLACAKTLNQGAKGWSVALRLLLSNCIWDFIIQQTDNKVNPQLALMKQRIFGRSHRLTEEGGREHLFVIFIADRPLASSWSLRVGRSFVYLP